MTPTMKENDKSRRHETLTLVRWRRKGAYKRVQESGSRSINGKQEGSQPYELQE